MEVQLLVMRKNGIINGGNMAIIVHTNKSELEYDIWTLVRAFYPQNEVLVNNDKIAEYSGEIDFTIYVNITEAEERVVYSKVYIKGISIIEEEKCDYKNCKEAKNLIKRQIYKIINRYSGKELPWGILTGYSKVYIKGISIIEEEKCDYKNCKEAKNLIKRQIYKIINRYSGKELPWGILTGIRPTKLAVARLEAGAAPKEVAEYLKKEYLVSDEKIDLGIEIAKRELKLLEGIDYENGYSLYIGIPFCPSTCLYCSFTSYPISMYKEKSDMYVAALLKEIEFAKEAFKDKKLNTVYFGGGTPTALEAYQLEKLLKAVRESFDFIYCKEFTVEAGRPDSITKEKLLVLKKYGVTRISINPQTMKQETLDIIGRRHTVADVIEKFNMAREVGFDNINMDFIVGLPNEGYEDVKNSMEDVKKLNPDSITIHSLAIKRASRLNMFKDNYKEMTIENNMEIMKMTHDYAVSMGMGPYYMYRQKNMAGNMENVGYARVDKAGIYNILIMEEKQTILALGAGAVTKYVFNTGGRIERVDNVKNVDQYIDRIDEMIKKKRDFLWKMLS